MGKKKNKQVTRMPGPKDILNFSNFGAQKTASECRRLTYSVNIQTNSTSGSFQLVVGSSYLRSNAVEWANYAARWVEYRVVRTRVFYAPITGASTGAAGGHVTFGVDRSGVIVAGALGSPTVWALAGGKVFNHNNTERALVKYSAVATDLEEQNFTAVGSNSVSYSICCSFNTPGNVSGPTSIGVLFIDWLVEFRGPQ